MIEIAGPALVGGLWAALVAAAGWRRRPAPPRVRALLSQRSVGGGESGERHGHPSTWAGLQVGLETIGGWLLRRVRHPSYSPLLARRLGGAVAAAVACLLVKPLLVVPGAALAWAAPAVAHRRLRRTEESAVARELPEVVDLLMLAVGAGYTVRMAVAAVGRRAGGVVGTELQRAVDEAALGRRLADALDDITRRRGDVMRPLIAALVSAERYGAPLVEGLERLAADVRAGRRRRAEEAARRVPVKLLFPLVTCTLPAFGLLTVAPLIASALRSLRL